MCASRVHGEVRRCVVYLGVFFVKGLNLVIHQPVVCRSGPSCSQWRCSCRGLLVVTGAGAGPIGSEVIAGGMNGCNF